MNKLLPILLLLSTGCYSLPVDNNPCEISFKSFTSSHDGELEYFRKNVNLTKEIIQDYGLIPAGNICDAYKDVNIVILDKYQWENWGEEVIGYTDITSHTIYMGRYHVALL